jgi:hypothetical protein
MAMPIVEAPRPVTGGIDTHLDAHVAAVVDVNGGVLAVESFPTITAGFVALHDWLAGFGEMERVGVEGTGAGGALRAPVVRNQDSYVALERMHWVCSTTSLSTSLAPAPQTKRAPIHPARARV